MVSSTQAEVVESMDTVSPINPKQPGAGVASPQLNGQGKPADFFALMRADADFSQNDIAADGSMSKPEGKASASENLGVATSPERVGKPAKKAGENPDCGFDPTMVTRLHRPLGREEREGGINLDEQPAGVRESGSGWRHSRFSEDQPIQRGEHSEPGFPAAPKVRLIDQSVDAFAAPIPEAGPDIASHDIDPSQMLAERHITVVGADLPVLNVGQQVEGGLKQHPELVPPGHSPVLRSDHPPVAAVSKVTARGIEKAALPTELPILPGPDEPVVPAYFRKPAWTTGFLGHDIPVSTTAAKPADHASGVPATQSAELKTHPIPAELSPPAKESVASGNKLILDNPHTGRDAATSATIAVPPPGDKTPETKAAEQGKGSINIVADRPVAGPQYGSPTDHGGQETTGRQGQQNGAGSTGSGQATHVGVQTAGGAPIDVVTANAILPLTQPLGDTFAVDAAMSALHGIDGPSPFPTSGERMHISAPPTSLPEGISLRLAQAAAQFTDRPVEVTLSPEELGRVRMTLATHDGNLTMVIQADRPETLDLLRRHIDTLAQDFRDLGFDDLNFSFGHDREGSPTPNEIDTAEENDRLVSDLPWPEVALPAIPTPLQNSVGGGLDLRM
jgi:hypothetical protein